MRRASTKCHQRITSRTRLYSRCLPDSPEQQVVRKAGRNSEPLPADLRERLIARSGRTAHCRHSVKVRFLADADREQGRCERRPSRIPLLTCVKDTEAPDAAPRDRHAKIAVVSPALRCDADQSHAERNGFSQGSESATTSRRVARRRSAAIAGRRRQRQDARDHPSHGAPDGAAPRSRSLHPGRDFHQQGRRRDAIAGQQSDLGDRHGTARWFPPSTLFACDCCGATAQVSRNPQRIHAPVHHLRRRRSGGADQSHLPRPGPGRKVHAVSRDVPPGSATRRAARNRPQDVYGAVHRSENSQLASIYEQYEGRLRQANALDFDDLLLETVRLLAHDANLRITDQSPLRIRHDRRIPGHQSQPVRTDAAAHRSAQEHLRGGRRGSVHLRLARRRYPQHPGFRARLSERRR